METHALEELMSTFTLECRDLYIPRTVTIFESVLSPLRFFRECVATNRPALFKNGVAHWPAVALWKDNTYLKSRIGATPITVAVTPNGYADAVVEGKWFVTPLELEMRFAEFVDILEGNRDPKYPNGVYYIQKQNSNFTTKEYSTLAQDAERHIPWASEAFGKMPDAVNFWMGDNQAVTSMHKDFYENIYCVVRGSKTFTLLPPTDLPYVPHGKYKPGCYEVNENRSFKIRESEGSETIPWVAIDPLAPDVQTYPCYTKAHPISCTLQAGDVLYLPSLWFHHVQQSHQTIAVNFWYDMEFDLKFCYYNLLAGLSRNLK